MHWIIHILNGGWLTTTVFSFVFFMHALHMCIVNTSYHCFMLLCVCRWLLSACARILHNQLQILHKWKKPSHCYRFNIAIYVLCDCRASLEVYSQGTCLMHIRGNTKTLKAVHAVVQEIVRASNDNKESWWEDERGIVELVCAVQCRQIENQHLSIGHSME